MTGTPSTYNLIQSDRRENMSISPVIHEQPFGKPPYFVWMQNAPTRTIFIRLAQEAARSDGEQSDGFSPKEILERVSQAHNIIPGKGLRKQINLALRRGIDFGIVAKQKNKYRFSLNSTNGSVENMEKGKKKRRMGKKKKGTKKRKMKTKSRNKRMSPRKSPHEPPPRPRVMPPPNWTPKKRNLREEPIPKFIRHSDYPPIPL